jgi:peptidoglycan/xylan/chitin deacetylase (PgdA/CDA1 family)
MRISPAHVWSVTLGITLVGWLASPGLRPYVAAIFVLHALVFAWGIADITSQFFCVVFCRKPGEQKRAALTFDDGPDPAITGEILDILKRYRIKATFFVVGRRARQHPALIKRAFDEGHEIASHDLTHAWTGNFRTARALVRDLTECSRAIRAIIGCAPALYRPPVGLTNPQTPIALRHCGMTCIGWSRRARDSGNRIPANLRKIPLLAGPGEVILLHDVLPRIELKRAFLDELELLCKRMQHQGLTGVPVSELFGIRPYASGPD